MRSRPYSSIVVLILAGMLSIGGGILYLAGGVGLAQRSGSAQLGISFLGYTNTAECLVARFAVTNRGLGTAVAYNSGIIERKSGGFEMVAARASLHFLPPSTGDIIEFNCCDGYLSEPWRFTCHYAPRSIQTYALDLQNHSNGLGRFVVSHLPFASGGVACTIVATTDWIER